MSNKDTWEKQLNEFGNALDKHRRCPRKAIKTVEELENFLFDKEIYRLEFTHDDNHFIFQDGMFFVGLDGDLLVINSKHLMWFAENINNIIPMAKEYMLGKTGGENV
jgi:hypothetical protein